MAENTSLKYLLERFASNSCTREEFDQLLALVGNMEGEDELTEEMSRYWDTLPFNEGVSTEWKERFSVLLKESSQRDQATGLTKDLRRMIFRKWIMAAAAVMTLTAGYLVWQRSGHPATGLVVVPKTKAAISADSTGRNRALLTLADGSVIRLDTAAIGTIALQGGVRILKGKEGELLYSTDRNKTSSAGYNTITTAKGGKYSVVLSDGTKVWLNAASSIRFPAEFTKGAREVVMTGEGYFEVAKNVARPFHVTASNMTVEVLGTQFNLNAYREEGRVSTTLVQGAVRVVKTRAGNSSHGVLLKPGEQANLAGNGPLSLDRSPNMEEVTAWKNGNFYFFNTPVPVILREIARWYDLDIVYEGPPPNKRLTGTFSRNVGLEQLTAMLQFTGIKMNLDHHRLLILRN